MNSYDHLRIDIPYLQYWDLFLHKEQYPYLGRCYAWARCENADELLDMTPDERNELFDIIIPIWSRANQILW